MGNMSVNHAPSSPERRKRMAGALATGWMTKQSPISLRVRAVLSLPLLGLVLEWLVPLRHPGEEEFSAMLAAMLLLALWLFLQAIAQLKGWVRFLLNGLAMVLAGGMLFGNGQVWP